jgi:hypothetical protein
LHFCFSLAGVFLIPCPKQTGQLSRPAKLSQPEVPLVAQPVGYTFVCGHGASISDKVLSEQFHSTSFPSPFCSTSIKAATVTAGDCGLRSLKFPLLLQLFARIGFGFRGPRKKILGQELAGAIEAVGKEVTRFRQGDQVFAWTGLRLGAYAQYTCLPEDGCSPSNRPR